MQNSYLKYNSNNNNIDENTIRWDSELENRNFNLNLMNEYNLENKTCFLNEVSMNRTLYIPLTVQQMLSQRIEEKKKENDLKISKELMKEYKTEISRKNPSPEKSNVDINIENDLSVDRKCKVKEQIKVFEDKNPNIKKLFDLELAQQKITTKLYLNKSSAKSPILIFDKLYNDACRKEKAYKENVSPILNEFEQNLKPVLKNLSSRKVEKRLLNYLRIYKV